jgi:hypothetical protein
VKGKFKFISVLLVAIIMAVVAISSIGCTDSETKSVDSQNQRASAVQTRANIFARAEQMYPVPEVHYFLAREMLVKYVERQDVPDHPFYIYVMTDIGTILGYYVAQSAPVSVNAFLSSTEDIYGDNWGEGGEGMVTTTAPSIDGIYYGGAGSSAGSNAWFFFDAATDALIMLYDTKMFVSDQPLNIDAPMISITPGE